MLLVDTENHLFVKDEQLKLEIARMRPVRKWLRREVLHLEQLHRDYQVRENSVKAKVMRITVQVKYGLLTYQHLIERELSTELADTDEDSEGIHSDRRLTLFGYTHDTFGMHIVPMIRDQ